jgi:hypothetical protein
VCPASFSPVNGFYGLIDAFRDEFVPRRIVAFPWVTELRRCPFNPNWVIRSLCAPVNCFRTESVHDRLRPVPPHTASNMHCFQTSSRIWANNSFGPFHELDLASSMQHAVASHRIQCLTNNVRLFNSNAHAFVCLNSVEIPCQTRCVCIAQNHSAIYRAMNLLERLIHRRPTRPPV